MKKILLMQVLQQVLQNGIEIQKLNKNLKNKTNKIMATIQELNDKVDQLQIDVDAKQEQIAAAIAALQQTITDLQALIDEGGATPAQLQAVFDKVESARADLAATPVG